MSVDSENPDDLIFDDEQFPADSGSDQGRKQPGEGEDEEVVSDEQEGGEPSGDWFLGEQDDAGADQPGPADFGVEEQGPAEDAGDAGELRTGDLAAAFADDSERRAPDSADREDEGDILFGEQTPEQEPPEGFATERTFDEDAARWEGDLLSADDIGIPTEEPGPDVSFKDSDPLASDMDQDFDLGMDEEELQLVEHESELDPGSSDDSWLMGSGPADEVDVAAGGSEEGWSLEESTGADDEQVGFEGEPEEPDWSVDETEAGGEMEPALQEGTGDDADSSWLMDSGDESQEMFVYDTGAEQGEPVYEEADPAYGEPALHDAQQGGGDFQTGDEAWVGEDQELVYDDSEPGDDFAFTPAEPGVVLEASPEDEDEYEYGEFVLDDSDLTLQPNEDVDPEWAMVEGDGSEEEESFVLEDEEEAYAPEEEPVEVGAGAAEFAASSYPAYGGDGYGDGGQGGYSDAEATDGAPGPKRFRVLRMLSGLAAASVLIAAGVVALLRPELLGLDVEPELVDRVEIARPQIDLALTVPEVEAPPDPVVPDPVVPDPVIVDPVVPDPVTPDPVIPDPVVPDPVVPDPVIADPDPVDPEDFGTMQLGESGVLIGEYEEPTGHPLTLGVTVGSQAFAQLKNGNYFVGVVKKVGAPENVTLSVPKGEVTLALAELRTLTSLGSAEYRALKEADEGYVRLNNNSLLRGTILRNGRDDNVILEMKSNQILIPRNAIEDMGEGRRTGVHLDDSGDMEWVRRLVEEEMDRKDQGEDGSVRVPTQPVPERDKVNR